MIKPVIQLDQNTLEEIAIYPSIAIAAKAVGLKGGGHISSVCTNKRKSAGGYSWKFSSEIHPIDYTKTENKTKLQLEKEKETKLSSDGTLMKIIFYKNHKEITVQYQDEYKYTFVTNYASFQKSKYKNPYAKTIYGVACKGNTKTKITHIKKLSYMTWYSMIQRCYDPIYHAKGAYKDVVVCDDWLCYENFECWHDNNFYNSADTMNLDKDLFSQDIRIYSPTTCCFLPKKINVLFRNTYDIKTIARIVEEEKHTLPLHIYEKIKEKYNI